MSQSIFQQCQFEQCDATVLVGGPFCENHRPSKEDLLKQHPAPAAILPSLTFANRQYSKQPPSQSNGNPISMDPHEKTGDAITVKTPTAALGSTTEKKQLPNQRVARKTTNAGASKQGLPFTTTRNQDPRQPVKRNSTGTVASTDERPSKRPQISSEVNPTDTGVRHGAPLFTNNTSYAPPQIKSSNSEERDFSNASFSEFTLHPRKAQPTLLEAQPTHKQNGEQGYIAKPSHKDKPPKAPIPANQIIVDLTGDDSEPECLPRDVLHSNGQKQLENPSSGAKTGTKEAAPKSRQEEKSIEVQLNTNQSTKSHTTDQNKPFRARRTPLNSSTSYLPPRNHHPINIAPRPKPTPLPSKEKSPQPSLSKGKEKDAQKPLPPTTIFEGVSNQNDKVQHRPLSDAVGVAEPREGSKQATSNPQVAPTAPIPNSAPSTSGANSEHSKSRLTGNIPKPSKEQVDAYIEEILQRSRTFEFVRNSNEEKRVEDPKDPEPSVDKAGFNTFPPKRNKKSLNAEERRQACVAKHDADKFDSYIYGKLNEPNRPGSALFGIPDQPPRPVRPATHFAPIDPRVHWTRPRSYNWYRDKQDEISRRETRKSNFGRGTKSAAKRRKEAKDVEVDLPERVQDNPTWLSAVYELDEMANRYRARERKKAQPKVPTLDRKQRSTIDDSDEEMEDISS